jgi:antitoxin component HigA of HigAB toxin-antitoxin module
LKTYELVDQYLFHSEQAMLELDKYGVLEYLEEFYEVLHTQSAQWIVEDIDNYINQRKI